jgi:hypothetical protein
MIHLPFLVFAVKSLPLNGRLYSFVTCGKTTGYSYDSFVCFCGNLNNNKKIAFLRLFCLKFRFGLAIFRRNYILCGSVGIRSQLKLNRIGAF